MTDKKSKFKLVEVQITSANNGDEFTFPDTSQLNTRQIISLVAFSSTNMTKSPSNKTPISQAALKDGVILLKNRQNQVVGDGIPVSFLAPELNSGIIRKLNYPSQTVFNQCSIKFGDASNIAAGQVFCLLVEYEC